ncbi:hypothetical protein DRN63_01610, partial [Nanoarchaeota archaeon]
MTIPKWLEDVELKPQEEETEETTTQSTTTTPSKTEDQQLQQKLEELKKYHKIHPDLPQPDILYEESTPPEESKKVVQKSSSTKGAWDYETEREIQAGYGDYPISKPKQSTPEKTETTEKFEEFELFELGSAPPPEEPPSEPEPGELYKPLPTFSFFTPSMWSPFPSTLGYKPYEAYKEVRIPEVSKGTITEKLIEFEEPIRETVKKKRAELERVKDPFSQIVKSIEFSLAGLGYVGYQFGEGFIGAIEQWRGLGNIVGLEQPVPPDPFTAIILPDLTTRTEREWLRTHPGYVAGAIWGEAFDVNVLMAPFKLGAKGFGKLFPRTTEKISEFLTTKPVLRHIFKKEGKVTEIVKGKERITGIFGEGGRVEELGEFFTKTRKTVGEESEFLKKLWEYVDSAELRFTETRGRARVLGLGLGEGAIIEETLEGEYVKPASKLIQEVYKPTKTEKVVETGKGIARITEKKIPIELKTRPGIPEDIIDYTRYIVGEYGA